MKREQSYLILITLIISFLAACTALNKEQDNLVADQNKMTEEMDALVLTAVFETVVYETSVSEHLTQSAPTSTITPPPTSTNTPVPPDTPTAAPTIPKDIWTLQDECDPFDARICIRYTIDNRDVSNYPHSHYGRAIHVALTHVATGEKGYFVIGSDSIASIKLFPGEYRATYYLDCDETDYLYKTWNITERMDAFYCKRSRVITYRGSSTY